MKNKFLIIVIIGIFQTLATYSQEVYQHVTTENIYEYLDEMANIKIIEINSVIKPFSRNYIAGKLTEVTKASDQLNPRQQKELNFYLEEYKLEIDSLPDYKKLNFFKKKKNLATSINPLGFFYKDKLFTLAVKPIWGINYFFNENGSIYHRWGGAETYAYIGEHWGLYASLRDNTESKIISDTSFFTLREGGAYKYTGNGGGDLQRNARRSYLFMEMGIIRTGERPSDLGKQLPRSYYPDRPRPFFCTDQIQGQTCKMVRVKLFSRMACFDGG